MLDRCCFLLALAASSQVVANPITFEDDELRYWRIVNDTVMGGRSQSRFYQQDGLGVFEGYLSMENYGGFASVRRYFSPNFISDGTVQLRIKGDGRKYQLRMATPRLYRGMAYVAEFKTEKDEWIQVNFKQSDFTVRYRGRYVNGAPALDFAEVSRLGLLLGDKRTGQFRLEVKSILAVDEENNDKKNDEENYEI